MAISDEFVIVIVLTFAVAAVLIISVTHTKEHAPRP
jgi:hypothetical protein